MGEGYIQVASQNKETMNKKILLLAVPVIASALLLTGCVQNPLTPSSPSSTPSPTGYATPPAGTFPDDVLDPTELIDMVQNHGGNVNLPATPEDGKMYRWDDENGPLTDTGRYGIGEKGDVANDPNALLCYVDYTIGSYAVTGSQGVINVYENKDCSGSPYASITADADLKVTALDSNPNTHWYVEAFQSFIDASQGTNPTASPTSNPVAVPSSVVWDNPPTVNFTTTIPTIEISGPAPSTTDAVSIAILTQGTGAVVQSGQNVTVNYEGVEWSTQSVFDSSYSRGAPTTFNTSQVIPGFTAALVGQKVGTTLLVFIPSQYAYAANPPTSAISANADLVFLVNIQAAS